jgi:hypothetical protein
MEATGEGSGGGQVPWVGLVLRSVTSWPGAVAAPVGAAAAAGRWLARARCRSSWGPAAGPGGAAAPEGSAAPEAADQFGRPELSH